MCIRDSHDGELRAADVVVVGPLLVGVHPGDDAAVGCFAARRRDGQDAGHRQALPGRAGVFVQLPDVLFRLGQAVGCLLYTSRSASCSSTQTRLQSSAIRTPSRMSGSSSTIMMVCIVCDSFPVLHSIRIADFLHCGQLITYFLGFVG